METPPPVGPSDPGFGTGAVQITIPHQSPGVGFPASRWSLTPMDSVSSFSAAYLQMLQFLGVKQQVGAIAFPSSRWVSLPHT